MKAIIILLIALILISGCTLGPNEYESKSIDESSEELESEISDFEDLDSEIDSLEDIDIDADFDF